MAKVFIIAQHDNAHLNTIGSGIQLAQALNESAEVFAYVFEHFSGATHHNPRLAGAAKQALMTQRQAQVQDWMSSLGLENTPLHIIWHESVYMHACEYAQRCGFGLIVKSIHNNQHEQPLDQLLIRHIKTPLLFFTDNPLQHNSTIMVAVDLGCHDLAKLKHNQRIVDYGLQLSESLNVPFHLGYVIPIPKLLRELDVLNTRNLVKDAYKKHMPQLERYGLTIEQVHITAGEPDSCLYEMACRLKSRYVVIGTQQRQGVMGRLLGNTSGSLIGRIRSNILVLPLKDE